MALKNSLPISTMPVGKPVAIGKVDPADNPILIKNFSPQPDPVPRTPVPTSSTGGHKDSTNGWRTFWYWPPTKGWYARCSKYSRWVR